MRRLIAIWIVLAAGSVAAAAPASAGAADGRLSGSTQISFGCPGPVREGSPSCHPWRSFGHLRFYVSSSTVTGRPVPGTRRLVVSDAQGGFALRLTAGAYVVMPLPQAHTSGGTWVRARVRAGGATRILVRFEGFPKMV